MKYPCTASHEGVLIDLELFKSFISWLQVHLTTDTEALQKASIPINVANVYPATPAVAFRTEPLA
eukprot:46791-Pelagomonas_calceolata.AAC.4